MSKIPDNISTRYLGNIDKFTPEKSRRVIIGGKDLAVSLGAGIAKIPSDIYNLATNNTGSNIWEDKVNDIRDSLQSDELIRQREAGSKYFTGALASGTSFAKALAETTEKYPYYALNQASEYISPLGIAKAPSMLSKISPLRRAVQNNLHKLSFGAVLADKVSRVQNFVVEPIHTIEDYREK